VSEWAATVLVGLAIAVGIAGVILPLLPGIWLIWGAALVYGLMVGFGIAGWLAMIVLTGLAAVATGVVYYLPARKSGEVGLPGWGQVVIAGFAVVGFFVIPIVGAFVGLAAGAFLAALAMERDVSDAVGKAWTLLVEMLKGAAVQLGLALVMAVVWGVWAWTVVS
jgi:uncharacterized protein